MLTCHRYLKQSTHTAMPSIPSIRLACDRNRSHFRFHLNFHSLSILILAIATILSSHSFNIFPVTGQILNYHVYDSLYFSVDPPPGAPHTIRTNITYTPALFGNPILNPPNQSAMDIQLTIAWPDFKACSDLRVYNGSAHDPHMRSYAGKAMLVLRGDCTFGQKAAMAQAAGAAMMILYSCSPLAPSLCSPDRVDVFSGDLNVNITTLMINYWDGDPLSHALYQACEGKDCEYWIRIPGTGPIHPDDRHALSLMADDFDFTYIVDRSGQSGSLPSFDNIRDHSWDPCINRLSGVWCVNGRIVILDLEGMNITGTLSPAIGQLSNLQQLILSSNNFYCTALPCTFSNLTSLRVLSLFHMGLQQIEPISSPGCLSSLSQLAYLDASFNKISDLPTSMLNWTGLNALSVANNEISSHLGPRSLQAFSDLVYLSLANNQIFINVTGMSFSVMTNIEYLFLQNNRIEGRLSETAFDNLSIINQIDLSNNKLSGRLPSFKNTRTLIHLDLSGNMFEGNCSSWNMPNLIYLSLASNHLSEDQQNLPRNFQSLQFLDLSNNFLQTPQTFTDIGAYLFNLMPLSIQTIHLENNSFSGLWGAGFLQTFPQLSHVYLSHNQINEIPVDIFSIGNGALLDLDLSFNDLSGSLPEVPPPASTTTIKFEGNPNFFDPNRQLPSWVQINPDGGYYAPTSDASYTCPSLIGMSYHLSVTLDPSYFGFSGCECNRGTYGSPPLCEDIPAWTIAPVDVYGQGTFTDGLFGNRRFFQGVDTTFVLGAVNETTHKDRQRFASDSTIFIDSTPEGSFTSTSHSIGEIDSNSVGGVFPPTPGPPVRAIYITFQLNNSQFTSPDDSISVYEGGLDLRGTRVILWQGTDTSFVGNIDLYDMFPPMTVTILSSTGVINFRSRHAGGTHFKANFTLSPVCPPGYEITTTEDVPTGICALPGQPGSSATIILLLVTSVIIGVLALCLLGQKMSTIQGLINGHSLAQQANPRASRREQAQELYGPVLSVEDSWRLQLKRDIVKESIMLGLELVGYASNWIVILQEVNAHVGPVLDDKFLVGYCIVVVCSTVTGFISVYARLRVMREIYHELKVGLALVPTIDMLLHHIKSDKERRDFESTFSTGRTFVSSDRRGDHVRAHLGRKRHKNSDEEDSLRPQRSGSNSNVRSLAVFGKPLLEDSMADSGDNDLDLNVFDSSFDTTTISRLNLNAPPSAPSPRDRTSSSSSSIRSSSPSSSFPPSNSSEQLKVRLSSKDPNVQLAWIQRSISTTKLTSFNVIFSTIPFLILNQIKLFEHNSISSDWALQVASLFASLLLGVKLLRILNLGELYQRRNELVFEVIRIGSNSSNEKKFPSSGMGQREGSNANFERFSVKVANDAPTVQPSSSPSVGSVVPSASATLNPMRRSASNTSIHPNVASPFSRPEHGISSIASPSPPLSTMTHHGVAVDAAIFDDGYGYDQDTFGAPSSHHLIAPATSLASHNVSFSHLLDASAGDFDAAASQIAPNDLHSFHSSTPIDETTRWARSNYGSELQMQPTAFADSNGIHSSVRPLDLTYAHPHRFISHDSLAPHSDSLFSPSSSSPHPHPPANRSHLHTSDIDSRTTSRSDGTSASTDSSSWIHSHMLQDEPRKGENSPKPTKMRRIEN